MAGPTPTPDACGHCGAPLAAQQRYCVNCGERLTAAVIPPARPAQDAPAATSAAAARRAPWSRPLPPPRALALGAMSLILAGTLLGLAIGPPTPDSLAAAARQVVVVAGTGTGTASPADDGTSVEDVAAEEAADAGELAGTPAAQTAPEPVPDESVVAAAVGGESGSAPLEEAPLPGSAGEEEGGGDARPAPAPSVGHAFVVVLNDGRGFDEAFGARAPAGYLRDELPRAGRLLEGYRAVSAGGLSGRMALAAGLAATPATDGGCPDYAACIAGAETKTVADQLSTLGHTWRAYVDGATGPCRRPDPLDPFVYFHSIVDTPDCGRFVLPLDRLERDVRREAVTPTLSWIAPAAADPAATDVFLRRWIPLILRSPAFRQDGLLAVVFDRAPRGGVDAPVGAVLASPFVDAGRRDPRAYDHYGLLRGLEDRLGLEPLGLAARRGVRSLRSDVFNRRLAPLAAPDALAAAARSRE